MAAMFDFLCEKCGTRGEFFVDNSKVLIPCTCGGNAHVIWVKAPGMRREFLGYHDIQLGRYIETRSERDRLLKERGLVAIPPDEWRHTASTAHEDEDAGWDHEAFQNAAEKAYNDLKYGNIPEPEAPADISEPIIK